MRIMVEDELSRVAASIFVADETKKFKLEKRDRRLMVKQQRAVKPKQSISIVAEATFLRSSMMQSECSRRRRRNRHARDCETQSDGQTKKIYCIYLSLILNVCACVHARFRRFQLTAHFTFAAPVKADGEEDYTELSVFLWLLSNIINCN